MKISPELMVKDINQSIAFYHDVLGFEITTKSPEDNPVFAQLTFNAAEILLYQETAFRQEMPHLNQPLGGTFALFIDVTNIKSWEKKLQAKTQIIANLHKTDYGTHEFTCLDPDGYTLLFSQTR
jgi:uncharacterized glyoxalase superfamily protein PhnB